MKLYQARITGVQGDDFDKVLQAGTRIFQLHFRWDTACQEQYDLLYRGVQNMRDADPLYDTKGSIVRDYDYLEYYASLPSAASLAEAIDNKEINIPQSLKSLPTELIVAQLLERIETAKDIGLALDVYKSHLLWHCDVTTSTDFMTAEVTPGGWLNNQSLEWTLRFLSDLAVVGRDDLEKVLVQVEVADE